ncbi:hypothetical protein BDR03DRAFT_340981 [Suillus americanus]|nr:hypothetical protein BDR03DRAFT_340981 [Suillus americanus]
MQRGVPYNSKSHTKVGGADQGVPRVAVDCARIEQTHGCRASPITGPVLNRVDLPNRSPTPSFMYHLLRNLSGLGSNMCGMRGLEVRSFNPVYMHSTYWHRLGINLASPTLLISLAYTSLLVNGLNCVL